MARRPHEKALLPLARGRPARLALLGPGHLPDFGVALVGTLAPARPQRPHAHEQLADPLAKTPGAQRQRPLARRVGAGGGCAFRRGGRPATVSADFGFGGGGGGSGLVVAVERGAVGSLKNGAHVARDIASPALSAAGLVLDGFGAGAVGFFAVIADRLAPATYPISLFTLIPSWEELLPRG